MQQSRKTERYFVMVDDEGTLKPLVNSLEEVAVFDTREQAATSALAYCNGRVKFEVFKSAT